MNRADSFEQRNSVSNEIDLPPVMGQEPPVSDIAKRKPADHPEEKQEPANDRGESRKAVKESNQ